MSPYDSTLGDDSDDDIPMRYGKNAKETQAAQHLKMIGKASGWCGFFSSILGIGLGVMGLVKYSGEDNKFATMFGTTVGCWVFIVIGQCGVLWETSGSRHHDSVPLRVLLIDSGLTIASLALAVGLFSLWKSQGPFEGGERSATLGWSLLVMQLVIFIFCTSPSLALYFHYTRSLKRIPHHSAEKEHDAITKVARSVKGSLRSAKGSLKRDLSRKSSKSSRISRQSTLVGSNPSYLDEDGNQLPKFPEPERRKSSSGAIARKPLPLSRNRNTAAPDPPTDSSFSDTDDSDTPLRPVSSPSNQRSLVSNPPRSQTARSSTLSTRSTPSMTQDFSRPLSQRRSSVSAPAALRPGSPTSSPEDHGSPRSSSSSLEYIPYRPPTSSIPSNPLPASLRPTSPQLSPTSSRSSSPFGPDDSRSTLPSQQQTYQAYNPSHARLPSASLSSHEPAYAPRQYQAYQPPSNSPPSRPPSLPTRPPTASDSPSIQRSATRASATFTPGTQTRNRTNSATSVGSLHRHDELFLDSESDDSLSPQRKLTVRN